MYFAQCQIPCRPEWVIEEEGGGRKGGGHTVSFVSGGLEKEKEGGMEDINVVIIRPFLS